MHDSLASKAEPASLDIASDRSHTAFPPALGPAVRSALERVIASPDFPATERNRRFLSFVVEATLDGRTDEITGPMLAKRIFMRGDDFKSTKDPIVRIEARSLRRDLETYYLKSGRLDQIAISLPKGSYRPHFVRRSVQVAEVSLPPLSPCALTLASIRLADDVVASMDPPLRTRLADALARVQGLAVFIAPEPAVALLDSETVRLTARRDGSAYVLSGEARSDRGELSFVARLYDGAAGQLSWSEEFFGDPISLLPQAATRIAQALEHLAHEPPGRRVGEPVV